jgi:hypothetical protein
MIVVQHASAQSIFKMRAKKSVYKEVDLEEMIKRYFGKEIGAINSIEGIYSVSCVITKKSRHFLTGSDKFRVVERKDNYARIAILKDWPGSNRDFLEVSMSYHVANKYPIVGELERLAEGNGYIYTHFEPDGTKFTFSMIHDNSDLIDGEYSKIDKRKTITYKLSYLKIYPKAPELNVRN